MPAPLKTIAQEWNGFAAHIFKNTPATLTQRCEMRKAFYAGVYTLLAHLEILGDDSVSEQDGADHLAAVSREIEAFKQEMLKEFAEGN